MSLRAVSAGTAAQIGAIPESEKGQPGGVAELGGDGKIPASQLPPLQHDVGEAADQAAMLALDVQAPAIAIRTDFNPPHIFYLTADPASTLANWVDTGEFGSAAANPTAQVGLTAVNGVLTTYMRSDAAPPINQAIAPTWTGIHQHSADLRATGALSAAQAAGNAGPTNSGAALGHGANSASITLFDATQTANNRTAEWMFFQGKMQARFKNDAANAAVVPLAFAGGDALGITGIESNSGTGAWVHTGPLATTKAISAVTGADGNKLWLAKYSSGSGHTDAPKTLGAASTYIQVGGREYGSLGFAGIGFGYVSAPTDNPAVWVGHEETQTPGNTAGDFLVATRPGTTNVAPTERMRILAAGGTIFSGVATASMPTVSVASTIPVLGISNTGAPADQKRWSFEADTTSLFLRSYDDAGTTPKDILQVVRLANVVKTVTFGNDTDSPGYLWAGTGPWTVAGSTGNPGEVLVSNGNAVAPSWQVPLPAAVASTALINQSADANNGTLYAVPADGTYRVSCYVVLTRAATTSATLPGCNVSYTDLITNTAMTSLAVQSVVANTVGTHLNGAVVLEAKSGTNIGFSTTGYASSGATTMQYRVRVVIERLQ